MSGTSMRTAGLAKVAGALACCLAMCLLMAACGSKQLTTDELIEQKDAWAEGVFRSALDDLASQGIIDAVPHDAQMLSEAFEYEKIDGGYGIAFKDAQAASSLTGDFSLPAGKVMLCDPEYNKKMRVFYLDGGAAEFKESAPDDAPLFFPESMYGYVGADSMAALLEGVDPGRFADDFDGCDYLIAFGSVFTHVDEGYYLGSINRTSCTTFVFVVDAKAKKALHIENVGTDTPPSTVKMGGQTGQMLYDELIAYLNGLL